MNPVWLARNIRTALRYSPSSGDAIRRLAWMYGERLPANLNRGVWKIGFRYPNPIGEVTLSVRANAGSDQFIHGEVFELNYYDLGLPFAPSTILDLGANIGLTAVYFARAYPKAEVACVEPMPGNIKLLRENLDLNAKRVVLFEAAIDRTDGKVFMAVCPKDYGHQVASGAGDETIVECEAISIPTILERMGWDRIGLLKIDIEGHEKVLLADECDWLMKVDAIAIEIHDGYSEDDLGRLAKRYGFSTPRLLPGIWLLVREA